MFICPSCDLPYIAPGIKYRLNVEIEDETGKHWVNAFNDTSTGLFQQSALQMHSWQDSKEENQFYWQKILLIPYKKYAIVIHAESDKVGKQKGRPMWIALKFIEMSTVAVV
ncbi:hypothetical protein DACRYDRAFT_16824 [Dacryopinax primogenitus]|uniref:Replication factor A C-terminal domain-containing protein n=1 Tax=Dacryopinax primogenitus (strain DJM 731) TaxID=1858805 RepID=M5G926_DACPD|nr:uncharacterized protein DACRYDRAFT_16824 [Dacryopinax primogenitus]EJU00288.1 hypothetical protein DACRYDRAFT_16824 [Dacryopinax primogenitus]